MSAWLIGDGSGEYGLEVGLPQKRRLIRIS
jgi:hypothetical protein